MDLHVIPECSSTAQCGLCADCRCRVVAIHVVRWL